MPVGAWDAPGYADAVRATGRRQLVMAMGAIVTTWSPLAAELLGDFARPEAMGLIRIYAEHQGSLRMVEDAFNVLTAAVRRSLAEGDNAAREGAYHSR